MRVALLTSWNERCGIADYSHRLIEELCRHVEVEVVPATFLSSPAAVYRAMARALELGDVAHVQHSYAFFGGMHPLRSGWRAFARTMRRPLVLTVHELDQRPTGAYHLPPPVELAYKRWFNRRVFADPAISRWMVHAASYVEALAGLGVPEERVVYRPIPVPSPPVAPGDGAGFRRRHGLDRKRVLVIMGFLARRKGYDVALAALRSLPSEYVLVAAGGEHSADRSGTEAWLHQEAERLGVADRFQITGFLDDATLEAATAAADVVLAPFREMSASASLNHALARGRAVIASDLAENRRLPCVRLFAAGDVSALARTIQEVCGSTEVRHRLEQAAREYSTQHSFRALAEVTVQLYRSVSPLP